MKIKGEKVSGIFIKRLNRFEALVDIDGTVNLAHVPNTGRLAELLVEGAVVILTKNSNPNRKTKYSIFFVRKGNHLICINSILANDVFQEGFYNGKLNLKGDLRREVSYGDSRLDFFINDDSPTLVEVKCCTFEVNNIAKFPDAPTTRGQKHIKELQSAVKEGFRCIVFIMVFVDYVTEFRPNFDIDPVFSKLLLEASQHGVEILAYNCSISQDEIELKESISICI